MLRQLQRNLYTKCQYSGAERLIVGVSGGPDSFALLYLLNGLKLDIVAAHVNHQLRHEADEEEEGVRSVAQALKIPFVSQRVDVLSYAKENNLSLEEAARNVRYRFLFEQAREFKAGAVVVAHTADDQVETFFLHLIRGCGLSGLTGMSWVALPNAWSKDISLIRPMLSFWRSEILEFVREKGLQPYLDSSNLDDRFLRNWVRLRLIPLLEKANPGIRKRIWQTCEVLQGEEVLLGEMESMAVEKAILRRDAGFVEFSRHKILTLPLGLQRRVIRRAWKMVNTTSEELTFEHIDRILDTIAKNDKGVLPLVSNWRWVCEYDKAYLVDGDERLPSGEHFEFKGAERIDLRIAGITDLGGKWHIQADLIEERDKVKEDVIKSSSPNEAWLDVDRSGMNLFVRKWKVGDRFAPLHLDGHREKLSDIFINRKIPRRLRNDFPLICNQDEIIWIPGYTISHSVRVTPKTQRLLHLTIYDDQRESEKE